MEFTNQPAITLGKLRRKEPVTILVVGDSNSVITFHTCGRMNWVGYLSEALWATYGDDLVTMINTSRCGYNWTALADELESRVLRWKPDLVILSLGLNDSRHGKEGLGPCLTAARSVITTIRGSVGAEVFLRTNNPVVYGYWEPRPEGARPGEACEHGEYATLLYIQALLDLARELGCPVCDHYAAWKAKHYLFEQPSANPQGLRLRMNDVIHPNAIGQLAFFRELAPHFGVPMYFPWEEVQ